jgi:hypothetical protein
MWNPRIRIVLINFELKFEDEGSESVKTKLGGWCEMAASLGGVWQLSVEL